MSATSPVSDGAKPPTQPLRSPSSAANTNTLPTSPASPASQPTSGTATATGASFAGQPPPTASSTRDADAVSMDPSALWAALDLPAPESLPSQHTARRVVLLGRPLSGKRTICRRLCFAAEAQYAVQDDHQREDDEAFRGAASADNGRQPLYRPTGSDDDDDVGNDAAPQHASAHVGGWNMPGAYSTVGAVHARTPQGPHNHRLPLSHGSGVCFDYVVQRVPTRIARGAGASSTTNNNNMSTPATGIVSSGGEEKNVDGGSGARRVAGAAGGSPHPQAAGTVRRTTEFFCCDSAGALSMALPTIEDVETAVVLMVIDLSDLPTIRQQLDFCYTTLNTYVASLLRAQAPSNDEVRRLQLAAAQQDYWFAEEQKLRSTRTSLASSVTVTKEGKSDVVFKDAMANLDKVNSTTFRIPSSAGTVCTMHTVIVCTKSECLERASRAVGVLDGSGGGSESEALFNRLGISADVAAALRRSRLSLMSLVAQMVRHYAIYRRAAVASLSQRVNMTTAGADGEYAGSTLVNPFYKGFWAYLAYVLYSSSDANSCPSSDVLRVCSARMHPHALLPCGLDAPGLLNHFVTSDPTQFAELLNGSSESAADAAIRTTTESVLTPDGVFALHQKYIQQAQADASATWAHPEVMTSNVEDTGMIWDSL